jgi:hypothetical protein
MHFLNSSADPNDVWTPINGHVTAAMWDFVCPQTRVETLDLLPLDGGSAVTTKATDLSAKWTGAGTGSDYIPQGCGVATLRTLHRGRSYRGRVFLPHVAEGEQTSGVLSDVAACQTAWSAFLAAEATASNQIVVASYKLGTALAVDSILIRSLLRTQRRRNRV